MSNIAEEAKRNRGRVSVPRKRTVKKPRLKDTAREFKGTNPPLGFYNLDQEIVRGKNKMLPFRMRSSRSMASSLLSFVDLSFLLSGGFWGGPLCRACQLVH